MFWFTSINDPTTSYSELNSFTVTMTLTTSLLPSGYVTVTTPALSPGPSVVLGTVVHVYVVPSGKLVLSTLVPASGVAP